MVHDRENDHTERITIPKHHLKPYSNMNTNYEHEFEVGKTFDKQISNCDLVAS